jgi:hypothetical protein
VVTERKGGFVSFFKRLTYCITLAIIISALSSLFYSIGGEFAAVPGIILEGLVNVVIVEITNDTFAGFVNRWMYFNVIFYTTTIFFVSMAVHLMKQERKEARRDKAGHPHSNPSSREAL